MKTGFNFFCPTIDQPHLPLLIFLPGMDGTGQLFEQQVKGLEKYFNIRCLSIPKSDRSDWEILTKTVTNLIEAEWEKLKQPEIYLCGESFGGCLALLVGIRIAKILKQLILINPASSFSRCPWLSWGIHLTPRIPSFLYPYSNLALLPWLASLERITQNNRQALLNAMQSLPGEIVSWRLSLLDNFSLPIPQINSFIPPVLIIASKLDCILPSVEESIYLKNQFPNANLIVLPKSGHTCLLEEGVHLNKLLKIKL
jgi:pimeloyl-ACP methyl ester carboxylesterase